MDASLRSRAEQLAGEIASQARTAEDLNDLMRLMMKSALEQMLNTEMDVHLGRRILPTSSDPAAETPAAPETPASAAAQPPARRSPNRRNGRSKKTVRGSVGELTIATPRDRDGTFQPQLIGKHQRRVQLKGVRSHCRRALTPELLRRADSASTPGSGIDATVLEIARSYDIQGRIQNVTGYNAAPSCCLRQFNSKGSGCAGASRRKVANERVVRGRA